MSEAGPALVCAGADPAVALELGRQAASLLAARRAIVLAAWSAPALPGDAYAPGRERLRGVRERLGVAASVRAGDAARTGCAALQGAGWTAEPRVVHEEREPWEVVLRKADSLGAALIVAGARERLADTGVLGRQARALAQRSAHPLLILPPGGAPCSPRAPAVIAFDGSAEAAEALSAGRRLLRARPALTATVWESVNVGRSGAGAEPEVVVDARVLSAALAREAARLALGAATALAGDGWRSEPVARQVDDVPGRAIVEVAHERDAALVVVGSARSPAAGIGAMAEVVLREARRPVLLVPSPWHLQVARAMAADAAARHDHVRPVVRGHAAQLRG